MTTTAVRPEAPERSRARRVLRSGVLVGSLVAFAVLAYVALATRTGQRFDQSAMESVVAGRETQLAVLSVLGYIGIGGIGLVALGCVALALLRGRFELALAAIGVIAASNVTTQLLKHELLQRATFDQVASNSLPSGHTTLVASAVAAGLLVAPRALRPLVVGGGAFAVTLTGASTVVAGWHRPSDVVAAVLVVMAWTALAALLLDRPRRSLPVAGLGAYAAVLGAGGAVASLIAIGVRPTNGMGGFLEAGLVLGAVSLSVAVGVALLDKVSPTE